MGFITNNIILYYVKGCMKRKHTFVNVYITIIFDGYLFNDFSETFVSRLDIVSSLCVYKFRMIYFFTD